MYCVICGGKLKKNHSDLFDDRYGAPGTYSIYSCKKCCFAMTCQSLSKNKIGKFYEKYYPLSKYNAKSVKSNAKVWNKFLAWLMGVDNTTHWKIRLNSKVLDIGSGSGQSLLEIKMLGGKGYGVEPDPSAQKIAKKLDLNVFTGFLSDRPFPNLKFDYITANQVIEHDPDPLDFLKCAKKKIKKDGLIILSFPNYDSIYRKIFGRKWINWHVPYHINFFNKKSFTEITKRSGLKIIAFRTITPNMWTVMQVEMLFSKSEVGVKNKLWSNKKVNYLQKFIHLVIFMLFVPINRIIDFAGQGDSIFVELKNEK